MKELKAFFEGDQFAARNDIELLEVAQGHARAKMTLHPHHWNGLGMVHGGAIFTLADFAFAAASNSHGTMAVALNVSITYVKAAGTGTLWAEAREVSRNVKVGVYSVEIRDDQGDLVAQFQGLAYRKKERLPVAVPEKEQGWPVERTTELKYRDLVQQIVSRLQGLPAEVWPRFVDAVHKGEAASSETRDPLVEQMCLDAIGPCSEPELRLMWLATEALFRPDDKNPDTRAVWQEGVVSELYERVRYAAGDTVPDGGEPGGGQKSESAGDTREVSFRLGEHDVVFLSKVARQLALLAGRPGLAPEDGRAIRRAVAALKKLPEATPGLDLQIEVAHRMGDETFSEIYRYVIALGHERMAIRSSGSQHNPATGTNAFDLESVEWRADGQVAESGNRDSWLERLTYALGRSYTVSVTDESGAKGRQG